MRSNKYKGNKMNHISVIYKFPSNTVDDKNSSLKKADCVYMIIVNKQIIITTFRNVTNLFQSCFYAYCCSTDNISVQI